MKVVEAIYTLKRWFDKHNINIEPSKFEVVLRFKDFHEFSAFEWVFRKDATDHFIFGVAPFHSATDLVTFMGIKVVVETPGNCSCETCKAVRGAGWNK